jgi:protein-S-isoprenylcysteine O-methyltransferase Ste14
MRRVVSLWSRVLLVVVGAAAYLALAVVGLGGLARFFAEPPLIALAIVFLALSIAALFAGGSLSPGVREDRANRWVLLPIIVLGLLGAFVPAWCDRHDFWTIDGEVTRWLGVVLFSIGGALRLAPVFILGDRFSGLVAIQRGHALVTTGLYSVIRHPSYLGLLLGALGWALAFRSTIGVLLVVLMIPPIIARIRSEETLLHEHFGAEYDAYRAKTSRLIPGIY